MTSPYDTGVRVREYEVADPAALAELETLRGTVAPQQISTGVAAADGAPVLHVYRGVGVSYVVPVGEVMNADAWSVEDHPSLTAIRDEYLFCLDEGAGE